NFYILHILIALYNYHPIFARVIPTLSLRFSYFSAKKEPAFQKASPFPQIYFKTKLKPILIVL
ncbi:MAG: hypothetical protein RSD64_03540, partial [Christensenellaceae bacterium]